MGSRRADRERCGNQQIPIRTFQDWNEARPGFMETDLVAHCGTQADGSYLYTLTLTDIADFLDGMLVLT